MHIEILLSSKYDTLVDTTAINIVSQLMLRLSEGGGTDDRLHFCSTDSQSIANRRHFTLLQLWNDRRLANRTAAVRTM